MRNYKEAAKCFEQALKYNPDNLQIHRDAGNLYLHSRDYISYKETSRRFLMKKPELLSSWCNYALSCNMTLDYEQAIDNLNSLLQISADDKNVDKVSKYNILMYKAEVLKQSGRTDELITFLLQCKADFTNKIEYATYLYKAYLEKQDKEQAAKYLKYLVNLLPENKEPLVDYAKVLNENISEGLKEVRSQVKSSIIDALILEFYTDEDIEAFRTDFDKLMISNADRLNPNFIQDVRCFANSTGKLEAVRQVYLGNIESLKANKKLLNGKQVVDPTYTLFMLSQFALFLYWTKDYQTAITYVEEAIEHTSTFQDLYVLKAKILKKTGRIGEAMEVANFFQGLDTADRCLTKAAVRVLLDCGDIVRADKLFKRFMQENNSTEKNIHDLQKMSYELRMADAYMRNLNFNRGLRLYKMILEHIDEFSDDQHDFYTFCLRKFLMKNLLDVIRFNDLSIKKSKIFVKSYVRYIEGLTIYLKFKENGFTGVKGDTNVVEVNEDVDRGLDVTGAKFMAKLNPEEEIKNSVRRLNISNVAEVKPKQAKKLHAVLFDYYVKTEKVIPTLRSYYYLIEHDVKTFENKLRRALLQEKLGSLDSSKLTDIEKLYIEEFQNTESAKFEQYLQRHVQENTSNPSQLVQDLSNIILKGSSEKQTDKAIAESLVSHLNGALTNRAEPFGLIEKKRLLKIVKKYTGDANLYTKLKLLA